MSFFEFIMEEVKDLASFKVALNEEQIHECV